ncbi:MAG: O-methyltransferase [Spirochaetales bacterium]|nr:O-methyltransferase [Spirochaetales bacterium]
MFNEISPAMLERMRFLEKMDAADRADGTERMKRLRQIPPETGKFLALLAVSCPMGDIVEIGTSAGYSTMWLYLAAREKGVRIRTFELLEEKIKLAKETFVKAGIRERVDLIEGDALENLSVIKEAAFCFMDCEKEIYEQCWELVSEKVIKSGFIVADNVISHGDELQKMIDRVMKDERFDSMIVPIGKGELVCRRK